MLPQLYIPSTKNSACNIAIAQQTLSSVSVLENEPAIRQGHVERLAGMVQGLRCKILRLIPVARMRARVLFPSFSSRSFIMLSQGHPWKEKSYQIFQNILGRCFLLLSQCLHGILLQNPQNASIKILRTISLPEH